LKSTNLRHAGLRSTSLNKISRNCFYLFCLCLVLGACAGGPKPKPEVSKVQTEIPDDENVAASPQLNPLEQAQLKKAVENLNQDKLEIAKKSLQKLQSSAPPDSFVLSNLATIAFAEKNLEEAQTLTKKALTLNQQNAQAHNLLGLLAVENGDISAAEQAYIKALTINGNYIHAHYNLALVYDIYYQDLSRAIKHYQAYLTLSNFEDEQTLTWVQELERSLEDK